MQNYLNTQATNLLPLLKNIRLLALDVDGVLTRSEIHILEHDSMKSFNALDGMGMQLAQRFAGVQIALITSSNSIALIKKRSNELGVDHVCIGVRDKTASLAQLLQQCNFTSEQCVYVGDDIIDLGAMALAAVGISVPNAHPFVREQANFVTTNAGGEGAVREVCDLILLAKGQLHAAHAAYAGA